MNRNEKRVMDALSKGYKIVKENNKYWLKKSFDNKTHTLSGVNLNTICWLHSHYFIEYRLAPKFCYELP